MASSSRFQPPKAAADGDARLRLVRTNSAIPDQKQPLQADSSLADSPHTSDVNAARVLGTVRVPLSQTLGNIVSKMGLSGTSPPFVTNGYGAWLRA